MWVLAWNDNSRERKCFDKELYTSVYGANVEKPGHRIFLDSLERAQSRSLIVEESDECIDTVIGQRVWTDQPHDLVRAC